MLDKKSLCRFLKEAKQAAYASGNPDIKTINSDKSTTITFGQGDWMYHDNYFGGEPYGGREVVFYKGVPVYMMAYYGSVSDEVDDIQKIYRILQKALREIPENHPYRGPEAMESDGLIYTNRFAGEVDDFAGEETIVMNGSEVYKAKYIGGLVDRRVSN